MTLKVLILEDSIQDMELIKAQLSKTGSQIEVTHTDNKNNFTEALEKFQYDLIISDFKLPGFNAFGALEICQKICPGVPFICVSGSIGEETAVELLRKGAVDYVLKDRPDRLPYAIKVALEAVKEKAAHSKDEQALIESEDRFIHVAETAQEWIWEVDPDGLYTYSSPMVETLLGYSPDEVVGKKHFYDFFVPEEKEKLKSIAFDVFLKRNIFRNYENINIHKNGNHVILSTSGSPIFNDHGILKGYRGVDEDITDRKRAEEKLKLLNRAVEASNVSVMITDSDGKIIYTNPFFTELTGYPIEEAVGKSPRILNSGNQSRKFYKELWDTILSGKDWTGEFRNKKKNGELYWESAIISPILDKNGAVSNFVAIKEDITERKRIIDELSTAKEKAEESDRLKSAFIHNISHEIRTPMNAIIGFSALLSEPGHSEESKNFFTETITQSSNQLLAIINDIVDISNIEAGIINLSKEEITVNDILQRLEDQFSLMSRKMGISLQKFTPLADGEARILADRTRFIQVSSNLINNAFKFTNEGSVEFGYKSREDKLEFYVSDTGIGIPSDQLTKIFDRFYQVDYKMTRLNQGTGLGLSISKSYVDLMGGEIYVLSEPGKGSTFYFTLPRCNSGGKEEQVFKEKRKIKLKRDYYILLAEDDIQNSELIDIYLSSTGLNVHKVNNGAEAVEYCRSGKPVDLALIDLNMPVMDGSEATRRIKALYPHVTVIIQTAYASETDKEKAFSSGCDDFITKPFDKEALLSKISANLTKK